jgi:hypothetical protein
LVGRRALTLGVGDAEELRNVDQLGALAADLEAEVGVGDTAVVCLGAVHGRLHLDSDVKRLCMSVQRGLTLSTAAERGQAEARGVA